MFNQTKEKLIFQMKKSQENNPSNIKNDKKKVYLNV